MISFNYETAALRVCIDRAEEGCLSGRILGRRMKQEASFSDIGSLLLQIEAILDEQKAPQAFQRGRRFSEKPVEPVPAAESLEDGMPSEAVQAAHGAVATFCLQIVTRCNATWQGAVDWLDGLGPQSFDSALELIKMLDARLPPH